MEDYNTANKEQKIGVLKNARFRKTWYISSGKNVGKATLKAPFPKNLELRLWTGKLPKTELDELIPFFFWFLWSTSFFGNTTKPDESKERQEMSQASQKKMSGKKQLPSQIPPFKTPRQLEMKKTDNESVRQEVVDGSETDRQGVVDVTETEQKDSGKDTPPLPCVFIPETGQKDKNDSGSDEDNIPFSEIQAMKTKKKIEIPQLATGEACVGNLILKKFETGVFKGTVMSATKL